MNLPTKITVVRLILTVFILLLLCIPFSYFGFNFPKYDFYGVPVELNYIIAGVILVLGVCLIPIIPIIVGDVSIVEDVRLIFFLYLLSTVASYLLTYKRSILYADQKEYILREAISSVKDNYDFIIIDCPPSLSMLTVNAMTTANTVLVPIQCEYYALEGLGQLVHTVNLVKERLNSELEMEGVVFTMFDSRTNLSLQVVENVKEHIDENVYKTIIPRNIRLAEAPSYGMPINIYEPKSAGAEAYRLLADEVIARRFD